MWLRGRGANSDRREKQQHGELRYLERRLGLGRGHGVQCRDPAKGLDDQHEYVEIERDPSSPGTASSSRGALWLLSTP